MSEQNKPNVREELVREVIAHMRGMEPWDGKTFDKELSAKLQRLATLSTPTAPKGGREVVGQQVRWRKDDRDEWCQWMNCTGWDGRDRNEVLRGLKAEFREIYADTHPNPEASTPTEAVKLLREIREQDYLSDSMRSRIDELMASALKGKDDA